MKRTAFVFTALILFGCKERTSALQAPPTGSNAAVGSSQGSPVVAPPDKASAVPVAPRAPGKWTEAEIAELAKVTFPGFKTEPMMVEKEHAAIRQYGIARPITYATVRVNPCQDCVPMDIAKWKEKKDALRKITLSEKLLALPDTEFSLGEAEVAGKKMISAYQLGYGDMAYSNAVTLWYNDGVNEVSVIAQYGDNMTVDRITMTQLVPRDQLEDMAATMMTEYMKRM
jgi:hypothetical protein